jgi:Sec-independent protein translocase protein TatA
MSIQGMGTLEILVVLLVAFVVLGPERMVDAGRLMGKAVREMRRLSESLPDMIVGEDQPQPMERPILHRSDGPYPAASDAGREDTGPTTEAEQADADGPVSFKPSRSSDPDTEEKQPEQPQKP